MVVWPGIAGLTIVWPGILDRIVVWPGIAKAVMDAVLIKRTKSFLCVRFMVGFLRLIYEPNACPSPEILGVRRLSVATDSCANYGTRLINSVCSWAADLLGSLLGEFPHISATFTR